jgi:hypothetical protein
MIYVKMKSSQLLKGKALKMGFKMFLHQGLSEDANMQRLAEIKNKSNRILKTAALWAPAAPGNSITV